MRLLKCDPETPSGAPNDAAAFPGTAKHQFKSIGQLGLSGNLEACSTRGIIYNPAINDGIFRANDQFGQI
jgi:hypothetical protein